MTTDPSSGMVVGGHRLPAEIMQSLDEASRATGVDFGFLVAQASVESGFKGDIEARRSSAAGLFQFTGQTWLQMMKEHGARYGHGDLAQRIVGLGNGRLVAEDPASEEAILDLRRDVKLSALFAAEFAKANATRLHKALGHKVGAAELHLAHLFGAHGAIRLLKAREANAAQPAAALVPAAAKRNPALFYDHGHHTPKSVAALYRNVQARIETPLREVAREEVNERLRPGPGLSDAPPARRSDKV
jgi:hypothetical protein